MVFAAWLASRRLAPLAVFLERYFLHYPPAQRFSTYVTHQVRTFMRWYCGGCGDRCLQFSHMDPWHFGFNAMALWSFGTLLGDKIGPEKTLALFVSGGVVAALASTINQVQKPCCVFFFWLPQRLTPLPPSPR